LRCAETLDVKTPTVEHDVEEEFLEFNELCPDAAVSFLPSIGIKI
jgi:hypothetical protein